MSYLVVKAERGHDVHVAPASECRLVLQKDGLVRFFIRGSPIELTINELAGGVYRTFDSLPAAIQHAQGLATS